MTQEELGRSLFRKLAVDFKELFGGLPYTPPTIGTKAEGAQGPGGQGGPGNDHYSAASQHVSPEAMAYQQNMLMLGQPAKPTAAPAAESPKSAPAAIPDAAEGAQGPGGKGGPGNDKTIMPPDEKGGISPTTWAILAALGLTAGGVGGYMLANRGKSKDDEEKGKEASEYIGRQLFMKLAGADATSQFNAAVNASHMPEVPKVVPRAGQPKQPNDWMKPKEPTSGLSEGPRLPGYNPLPPVQPPLKDFLGSLPPTGAARPIPYTPDDPTPVAKGGMSPTTWAILGALGLTAGGVGGYMLANQGNSEDEEEEKKKKPDVENNELDKKSSEELGRQLFRKLATPDQPNPGAAGGVAGAGLGTAAILGLLGTSLGVGGLGAGVGGLLGGARKRDDEGLGEAVFRGAGRGAFSGVGAGAGLAAGGMLGAGLASNAQDPRIGAILGLLGATGGAGLGGYLGYKGGEAFTGDGTTPSKAKPKEV